MLILELHVSRFVMGIKNMSMLRTKNLHWKRRSRPSQYRSHKKCSNSSRFFRYCIVKVTRVKKEFVIIQIINQRKTSTLHKFQCIKFVEHFENEIINYKKKACTYHNKEKIIIASVSNKWIT